MNQVLHRRTAAITIFLALLGIALLAPEPYSGLDETTCKVLQIMAAVVTSIHLALNHERNCLRIDVLFLVGFWIVNYQTLSMALYSNLLPENTLFRDVLQAHGTYATWLSTLGLAACLLGYNTLRPTPRPTEAQDRSSALAQVLTYVSFALFALLSTPGYFTADLYKTQQINMNQTVDGAAAYVLSLFEVFAMMSFCSYCYALIAQKRSPNFTIFSVPKGHTPVVAFAFLYVLAFLFAGERGQIIQVLSLAGVFVGTHIFPVKWWQLLTLLTLASSSMTAIGIWRSASDTGILEHLTRPDGIWAPTASLAGSSITLYQGIDVVHSGAGYYFGRLWLSQILGLVPFLSRYYLSLTHSHSDDISSSYLITRSILGDNIHTGFGTSIIVDTYMNFGPYGVILVQFLLGVGLRFCAAWMKNGSGIHRFFIATTVTSLVFYMNRSSVLVPLKTIAWGLLLLPLLLPIDTRSSDSRSVPKANLR